MFAWLKLFKGKRTILFNLAVILSGVAAKYGFNVDPATLDMILTGLITLIPSGNILLRFLTTTPQSLLGNPESL